MHPLTVFPSLLTYQFFVPAFLRIVVAVVLLWLAWQHLKNRTEVDTLLGRYIPQVNTYVFSLFIFVEFAAALCLFFGFYTQVAAIVGALIALKMLLVRVPAFDRMSRVASILFLAICISLLVTGAGAFALDIPL